MEITALFENTKINTDCNANSCNANSCNANSCIAKHGLSLYVETEKHKILIDLGTDDTIIKNAKVLGIDLTLVDIVIITHGHFDHCGGLESFLSINKTAKVYIQREAFNDHYIKVLRFFKFNIGINKRYINHPQIVLVDNDFIIDDKIRIITNPLGKICLPKGNSRLYEKKDGKIYLDTFNHEQSVLIKENNSVLFGGCAHRGIVNIIEKVQNDLHEKIDVCVSGFHLMNLPLKNINIASYLLEKKIIFYTCHCTSYNVYKLLKNQMGDFINYLSTGETIKIN